MFRNFLNPDNALMVTMSQITDCILLSLMWLLGCFPIITVGASSAALYDSVRQCLRGTERNPLSRFLKSFRRDLKAGLIPGLLYLAALWLGGKAMIALWNSAVGGSCSWMVFAGCAFVAVMMLGVLSVLFPLLSRFENPLGALLRNTVMLALANMPRTVALGVLNALCGWLCVRFIFPLFFLPALASLISTYLLEPMFKPYLTENAA
jgi:uncharacterized membrane protein YesL